MKQPGNRRLRPLQRQKSARFFCLMIKALTLKKGCCFLTDKHPSDVHPFLRNFFTLIMSAFQIPIGVVAWCSTTSTSPLRHPGGLSNGHGHEKIVPCTGVQLDGYSSLFRRFEYSEGSLFRRSVIPKVR